MMIDWLKRLTVKNYTAWDLNCPDVYKSKSASNDKKRFKRTARRQDKQNLKRENKENVCNFDI